MLPSAVTQVGLLATFDSPTVNSIIPFVSLMLPSSTFRDHRTCASFALIMFGRICANSSNRASSSCSRLISFWRWQRYSLHNEVYKPRPNINYSFVKLQFNEMSSKLNSSYVFEPCLKFVSVQKTRQRNCLQLNRSDFSWKGGSLRNHQLILAQNSTMPCPPVCTFYMDGPQLHSLTETSVNIPYSWPRVIDCAGYCIRSPCLSLYSETNIYISTIFSLLLLLL